MTTHTAAAAVWASCTAIGLLVTAHGRLAPHVPEWPHMLTANKLAAYVNKTFGPSVRCLRVAAADDTVQTDTVVAMLGGRYRRRDDDGGGITWPAVVARTIELDASTAAAAADEYGRAAFCLAYVVVARRMASAEKYFENFKGTDAAQRMLVIVVQDNRKYTRPLIKYSPEYFNYKDVIVISVNPQKETVFKMSIYFGKLVPISKHQDQWYRHDLEGKQKVKNFYKTRIKLLAYNNSFFSSVIKDNATGKLSLSHGVECSIFKEIARRLNITWDVYTSEDKDKWGTVWPNNTVTGGALRWLNIKQVDVSFCSLWIEKTKLKFVDMSRFWTLTCLKFLVPKPKPLREKWDLLFKPFPLSLWLLVFLSATMTTFTLWILAGIQKKIGYERTSG